MRVFWGLWTAILIASALGASAAQEYPETVSLVSPVVQLLRADGTAYCSGVFVTKNTIITAGHCVEPVNSPSQVKLQNGDTASVTVGIVSHSDAGFPDAAVLHTDYTKVDTVDLPVLACTEPVKIGDAILVKGYGLELGVGYVELQGQIVANETAIGPWKTKVGIIVSSVIPGISGSPIFNVSTHHIIGLAIAVSTKYPEWNVYTPIAQICKLLEDGAVDTGKINN